LLLDAVELLAGHGVIGPPAGCIKYFPSLIRAEALIGSPSVAEELPAIPATMNVNRNRLGQDRVAAHS
jgi:hypothetical protein